MFEEETVWSYSQGIKTIWHENRETLSIAGRVPGDSKGKKSLNINQSKYSFTHFCFLCWPGFTGEHCEHNIDDCPGHSCQNGGVCVDGVNTYNCRCPPHYTGDNLQPKLKRIQRILLDLCSHWLHSQVSTALRMWTSVSWCQMHVRMEEPATIRTAVTTASVSTGGRATTAARTLTTVPAQLVTMALPVTIVWLLSSASVLTDAQVHPTHYRYGIIVKMAWCSSGDAVLCLILCCPQDCCATWMMHALAIHAKRVPTVTPTPSMAKRSAPVPQATPAQPVI